MNNYQDTQHNDGFQWGPFILGVLSLILAFLAFNNPAVSIISVAILFGIGAILKGVFELFFRRRVRQFSGYSSGWLILLGVIDILIGVFFLFNLSAGVLALPVIFAFWVIFDSIGTLVIASAIRQHSNTQFWFTLIIGIIGLIIGFLLLFNPLSSYVAIASLVGLFFMIQGILNIVYAF